MRRRLRVRLVRFIIRHAHGPMVIDLGRVREWAGEDVWHEAIGDVT